MSGYIRQDSEIDDSVNLVWERALGKIEARYVRRHDDYVACYLSTQTGCAQACRMCHLTQTGQTRYRDLEVTRILEQARAVLYDVFDPIERDRALDGGIRARVVHYNFMARGEPLDSQVFREKSQDIFKGLYDAGRGLGLMPRFLVSTIMPKKREDQALGLEDITLPQMFPFVQPEIYYSLYSVDPDFRRRWLPRAMDPSMALDLLAEWQQHSKKIVRIHYALIRGENDSLTDAVAVAKAVREAGLRADFTFVRYNPPAEGHSEESSWVARTHYGQTIERELHMFAGYKPKIKVIERVGEDVAASCGMFVS